MTTSPDVAILADDLTGALDAAVRFRATGEVVVMLGLGQVAHADANVIAVDTASRDLGPAEARDLAKDAVVRLGRLNIPVTFKKMDSRLRGHVVREIVAMLDTGPWSCALVAPALPEQGRTLHGGRLRDAGLPGPSLLAAFEEESGIRSRGIGLGVVRSGVISLRGVLSSLLSDKISVLVCDAERTDDLDVLVQAASEVQDPSSWLWCGSAGLAGALAGNIGSNAPPPASPPSGVTMPFVGLIGSPDPIARAQLRAAEACGVPVCTLSPANDLGQDRAIVEAGKYYLERGNGFFLAAPSLDPGETPTAANAQRLAAVAVEFAETRRPRSFILSGGDTAREVCRALGVQGLRVTGELAPGVPVSETLGPSQVDGLMIVTKAGSFGPAHLWCTLLRVH